MAPIEPGHAPHLASFLAYLKDKENKPIESCIEYLVSYVKVDL
jgi:hypothetical protein